MFSVEKRVVGDVIVLDLSGKITIDVGTRELGQRIRNLLDDGAKKILLNFRDWDDGVTYMDTSASFGLRESWRVVANSGGHLKLMNLSKKIQDLLIITKLLTIFEHFDNEETALASFEN